MFNPEELRSFIVESGLKQKAVAERAGISERALSLVLTGKQKCDVNVYSRLCAALGQPLDRFLTSTEPAERAG